MNVFFKRSLSIVVVLFTASCTQDPPSFAESIYFNGNIITIDDTNPFSSAIAIKNGLILDVGNDQDILMYRNTETKVVDLNGKTVVPGFIDAHSHFGGVGTQAIVANLLPVPDGPVNTIADLQTTMRNYIQSSPIVKNYNVAIGFNYDDSQLTEKRHPTRHDLDAISTSIPIVIMHQSGHLGVYNTKALELMGVTAESKDPSGGVIGREADGKTPNGVMQENAHFMIFYKLIPDFTEEDLVQLYKAGEYSYISNGFTTVQEGKTDLATLDVLPKMAESVGFDIDIISYPDIAAIGDAKILHGKLMSRDYTHGFRMGGVKLTFDGSPQGKTAWFTQPYYKVPEGQNAEYLGYPAFSDEEALKWMTLAFDNKWQLLVHTNGDAAIDQLIKLVEQLQPWLKNADHRTVMIHGQFTRKDQVEQLKKLGIFPSLYPMHTFYWGDWHRDSVAGVERANNISPSAWFLNEGMRLTIHSDSPVTFPNAMRLLDSAVNRTTRTNKMLGVEHQMEPLDALKAITLWSAYQHFEEQIKGSLEIGKQADMVILDKNPLTVPRASIKDIKVLETINNGKSIFSIHY
ncbi:amidohydrolase [Glaciecola sp. 33A]|jgi:predicted amidohydrolase YtcJ|uniref:amidohydrolase n=1 Tax=Glaciecola sp. 33A TaxID=2057807 RepID=UPI000C3329D7|nr:amidohydrolase [Glaciecola sp. 33A]PKI02401.1 amidohydrolase [Glaciecola sp. 33A]